MKCQICKYGETKPGTTTVILERNNTILVFKNVPAEVCLNCEESYVDQETTKQLFETAEEAVCSGVQVDIREFAGALV